MKKVKLLTAVLIGTGIAILSLALVGVGQAQQLTCWSLTMSRSVQVKVDGNFVQQPSFEDGKPAKNMGIAWHTTLSTQNMHENFDPGYAEDVVPSSC